MFAVFSPAAPSNIAARWRNFPYFAALFALLLAAHLRHSGVLWAEEDLPLAVALQMKRGATIYRDVWFDKPPLVPAVYLVWGAAIGPVLRMAGAVYCFVASLLAYAVAARLWSRTEGYIAAGFLAFFLTFDTQSAVLPLAADLLLLAPHMAAVYFAIRGKAFLSGLAAGVGFLFNAKAVLVLAICSLFAWPSLPALFAGFMLPNALAIGWLFAAGALPSYIDQVWRWPAQYAASPIVSDPIRNGLIRTLNWMGFHAALAIGAAIFWFRERPWKFIAWVFLAYVGVALGFRFFPRYFFLMLPALAISAARGWAVSDRRLRLALLTLALLVPLIRFAPRYVSLANWADLALDRDSRAVSGLVRQLAKPDSTLYVWGYRPEIFVYTGLKPATKYLECQAMTGVPADRHLTQSAVVLTEGTHEAREALGHSSPDVFVDGLSLYNPALSVRNYPELRGWFAQYREAARTKGTIVYLRSTMR